MTLCACGCGVEAGAGFRGKPRRYLPRHHLQKTKNWDDYPSPVRDLETGCLRWSGPHYASGYGRIGSHGYAHVEAYRREYGDVPGGLEIDHVHERGCRWKDCVEPAHLEAVTHLVNVQRAPVIAARMAVEKCPAEHPYTDENTIINQSGSRSCRKCQSKPERRKRKLMRKGDR